MRLLIEDSFMQTSIFEYANKNVGICIFIIAI